MENSLKKLLILEDIFKCPVKLSTLYGLYGRDVVERYLKHKKKYIVSGGLVGRKEVLLNKTKLRVSARKIKYARKLARLFKFIPWVRFTAVSGAVSFGNAEERSDIDIFIITAKNRLWLTRGIEAVLFYFLGVRRVLWRKGTKDKLCINFYTSEENLNLDIKKKFRFLTALEIVMLKPVYKEKHYGVLLSENRWVKEYFPELKIPKYKQIKFIRVPIISQFIDVLDYLAMRLQILFMKIMKHSMKNSNISRNRVTFFDENKVWEKRQGMLEEKL